MLFVDFLLVFVEGVDDFVHILIDICVQDWHQPKSTFLWSRLQQFGLLLQTSYVLSRLLDVRKEVFPLHFNETN